MKAREIMTTNPKSVTPDTPLTDAARIMKSEDVGVVPVVDASSSKRLVGVLTDRDIAIRCVAEGKNAAHCRVSEIMSTAPQTARENDSVESVMELMSREQVRRIPIVDEKGALVGIVSQADVVLDVRDGKKAEKTVEKISQPGGKHSTRDR